MVIHSGLASLLALGLAVAPPVAETNQESTPAAAAPAEVAPAPAPAEAQPAPAPAAAPAPSPAAAPEVTLAPTPEPAPQPAAPAAAPAEPVPAATPRDPRAVRAYPIQNDPELHRQYRTSEGLIAGGAAGLGLGLATLAFVTLPAQALYDRSVERAERAKWVTDLERPREQARTRWQVMIISGGIGGALTVAGGAMLIAGLVKRSQLRRPAASTLSLAPVVGGGQVGMAAALRF